MSVEKTKRDGRGISGSACRKNIAKVVKEIALLESVLIASSLSVSLILSRCFFTPLCFSELV